MKPLKLYINFKCPRASHLGHDWLLVGLWNQRKYLGFIVWFHQSFSIKSKVFFTKIQQAQSITPRKIEHVWRDWGFSFLFYEKIEGSMDVHLQSLFDKYHIAFSLDTLLINYTNANFMHLLIGYLHEIQIWLTVKFNMNPIIGTLVLPNLWTQSSHWDCNCMRNDYLHTCITVYGREYFN